MKTLRTLPALVASFLLLLSTVIPMRGVIVSTWTGGGATGSVLDTANWDASLGGNDNVSFGDIVDGGYSVLLPPSASLNDVTFAGSARPAYSFDGASGSVALTLNGHVSASTAGSDATFTSNIGIGLSGITHIVDLVSDSKIIINGVVSDASTAAAIQKVNDGTLALNGANTFSGGLDLAGGWLLLGNDSAAGTGTLTLSSGTLAPTADITLANAIALNGSIKLGDCNTTNAITFSGVITGGGHFDAHGSGAITISGNNSGWTGGIKFYGNNAVFVDHANALGTGAVEFDGYSGTVLQINTGIAAAIGTLSGGDYEYSSEIKLQSAASLTINQASDGTYGGSITGYNDGSTDGGLVKTGTGTLTLTGPGTYYGPTAINAGTIIADGYYHQLGYGAVAIENGATLELKDTSLRNSNVTVKSGARITGYGSIGDGYIGSATTVQSGGILSPGVAGCSPIGTLTFDHLTLQSGAIYEWNLQNPAGSEGTGWDLVAISTYSATLHIDSTTSSKLTLKVISLDGSGAAGTATGFSYQNYSWKIFDGGDVPIAYANGSFDPNLFYLDTTGFVTDIGTGSGVFSLSADTYSIYLNFTPVPEPSTYALMALGLAGTGFAAWRKRRRA